VNAFSYLDLLNLLGPETILVLASLAALFLDLGVLRDQPLPRRWLAGGGVTALGGLLAILWLTNVTAQANLAHGILVVDPLTQLVKVVLVAMLLFTVAFSLRAEFTKHVGEYFCLLLLATVGMMFLVSSEDVLMIFVALELTSLSLYILTAFNKRSLASAEAGLKYFLFGGMAAAFTLFGLSLIYGLAGATNLRDIATNLAGKGTDPLLMVALIMVIMGFGFKIAAVPFHLWAPDAYQGAPTPAAALIASGSKVASFFVFAKVMALGFAGIEGNGAWRQFAPGWVPLLATLAVASMLLGNLAAIAQSSVKRLLAYSAIAHAGYMLLGLLAMSNPHQRADGMAALVYYVATYGLTTIGAFGVVQVVERTGGDSLEDFAGLSRRAPLVAVCLMVFMLSLAGIPPLAGFFGKFYLFTAAAGAEPRNLGLLWLVIFAIAMSAVSLYYYLQVLKRAFVAAPAEAAPTLVVSLADRLALGLLALAVVVLGALPAWLLGPIADAIKAAGF
jgi:NADH-quinone oxidoreductase subunit N